MLGAAARELSKPLGAAQSPSQQSAKIAPIDPPEEEDEPQHWRDIVQQRIDKKTRRFAHGPSQPEATPTSNKFAPVAGYFFFPLLRNFDK